MSAKKDSMPLQRGAEDTLPKLFLRNYKQWGSTRIALRKKEQGVWKERTWQDCYDRINNIFIGLTGAGLIAGERVAIIGDNDPEWFCSQLAAQSVGSPVVGINPARNQEETLRAIERSQPKFVMVQDQEQVDKVLDIRDSLHSVEKIIYWNAKGLRHYENESLISVANLITRGQETNRNRPVNFEEMVSKGKGSDAATLFCIWKNEDPPEIMTATHDFILSSVETALAANPVDARHEYVCVMNPGWFFEQILGTGTSLLTGRKFNYAESGETAEEDLREISPHSLAYPPQLWNQLALTIQNNMAEGARLKRLMFNRSLSVGCAATDRMLKGGKRSGVLFNTMRSIADFTTFHPLLDKHGLDKVRVAYSAGGEVAPENLRFFHAIGVNLKHIFGSTKDGIVFVDPGEYKIEQ